MKNLKKLTLSGVTLAALVMAAPRPAKADPLTTAISATTAVINAVITYNYGTIKWIYIQQKRAN